MTFYEKIKQMPFGEMRDFILRQIHSDCNGYFCEECEEEGYGSCGECVELMLMREVK